MANGRRKKEHLKAKSTNDRTNNQEVQQAWKLKVGRKSSVRPRNDFQLLKYFLIGLASIILGICLCTSSVYFLNNFTFLLGRSNVHSVGQQEVTHKLKMEHASRVVQNKMQSAQSEKACVAKDERLVEVCTYTNEEISVDKNKLKRFEKMSGSDWIVIVAVKNANEHWKRKKHNINTKEKKTTKIHMNLKSEASFIWASETPKVNLQTKNMENIKRKSTRAIINDRKCQIINGINKLMAKEPRKKIHHHSKKKLTKKCDKISDDTSNKIETKTNVQKSRSKKSQEKRYSTSSSDKKSFRKVSLVSKTTILQLNTKRLKKKSKKQNKNNLSQEINIKRKKDEKKIQKMKGRNESNSQKEYLPSKIRNFKRTMQKMIVPTEIFSNHRGIPPIKLISQNHSNSNVKVFIFEKFLSDNECNNLRRVHDMHVHLMTKEDPILCFDSVKTLQLHLKSAGKDHIEVSPLDFTTDTKCVNQTFSSLLKKWLKANWSYSTAFYPGENYFSKMYEQRVKQSMGLHPENGGKFQIISYPKGIGYKKHTDCIENSSDKRDRMATVIVYLDTVEKGGETRFPELGISVRPRKGRALVWNNMDRDGNCDSMSAHVANSVSNGKKYILQRWYYYQSFYSLGKRPPRTEKPKRKTGQARVSCDEYIHGSCRWYDEWNHDHLIQYHENKFIKI